MFVCVCVCVFRRFQKKGPEVQDEELPRLEDLVASVVSDPLALRRRTMAAAAAERRMQTHQDPAP